METYRHLTDRETQLEGGRVQLKFPESSPQIFRRGKSPPPPYLSPATLLGVLFCCQTHHSFWGLIFPVVLNIENSRCSHLNVLLVKQICNSVKFVHEIMNNSLCHMGLNISPVHFTDPHIEAGLLAKMDAGTFRSTCRPL